MDRYDEMYEIKNSREIDDSPPPDLDVSSSMQFVNEEPLEDIPKAAQVRQQGMQVQCLILIDSVQHRTSKLTRSMMWMRK